MRKVHDAKGLHLKWASVSTEIEEMKQQKKGEREMSSGYEKDSRWAVVSTAESYSLSLSTRPLEKTVDSNKGIKTAGRRTIVIMRNIHSCHFIRDTLLVPGWTLFAFRTALILRGIDSTRCWKHSWKILVHIDMRASHSCCRFVGCTSKMRISCSITSQRCSIGLRSGDCGGHWSTVNSLSCLRHQFEMIWALWHGALSCWK